MKHELYKTKEEIENWLNYYKIKNYTLIEDKEYGYVVNVDENVFLNFRTIQQIKIKFNIIEGDFNCNYSELISLYGFPEEIKGSFSCSNNNLISLEYCPKIINGEFSCSNNKINTLEYFPKEVNGVIFLDNNSELREIKNIRIFDKLYSIHQKEASIKLNKKLEKEITIDNKLKTAKIKL